MSTELSDNFVYNLQLCCYLFQEKGWYYWGKN